MNNPQSPEELAHELASGTTPYIYDEILSAIRTRDEEWEAKIAEKDKLIRWHKQDTHDAMEWKRSLEQQLATAREALKKIVEVGTKGAMHIGDTGYYTQECTIAMEALKGMEP